VDDQHARSRALGERVRGDEIVGQVEIEIASVEAHAGDIRLKRKIERIAATFFTTDFTD